MRKIILSLATIFAVVSVNAQQGEVDIQPRPTQEIVSQPSPAGVVIHNNNIVNNNTGPVVEPRVKVRYKTVYRDRWVSGPTYITNNHFHGDTARVQTLPEPNVRKNNIFPTNDWLSRFLLTGFGLALLMVLFFLLLNWFRGSQNADSDKTGTMNHAHTHNHNYPAISKVEPVKTDSLTEREALDVVATKGGSFSFSKSDGSYKIDIPSPVVEKKSDQEPTEKKEEQK